ncbi:MAG TPA: hypothetical protein VGR02_18060 [Thermoanaerobaculia bacterium]|nr:hypothetical protein [Thermoanaerobaculia bacterium]
MLSPTEELTGQRRHYDITIDGVARGQVLLEHYFKPTTGIYGEEVAVWAGRDVAIGSLREGPFRQIALPEPLLAVYRLRAGWLVVAEISVYLLDEALTVVLRRIHNEVLMSSSWSDSQLLVRDFAGRVLRLDVDESALSAGDFLAS